MQGFLHPLLLRGIGALLRLRVFRFLLRLRPILLRRILLLLVRFRLRLLRLVVPIPRIALPVLPGVRLALLPRLLVLLLLLLVALRRLALHRRFHRLAVGDGVGHAGIELQGTIVGGDGLFVIALLRQRIAVVVLALRIRNPAVGFRRAGEIVRSSGSTAATTRPTSR